MPWITTASGGGFKGSRLPLGAYRRVSSANAGLNSAETNINNTRAPVIWETVSSWDGSEETSAESFDSGASARRAEGIEICDENLQIRMERLRQLNPFYRVLSGDCATRCGAVTPRKMTPRGSARSVVCTPVCDPALCTESDGEDILLAATDRADVSSCKRQKLNGAATQCSARPRRVERLAASEWAQLLQLVEGDAIVL